MEADRADRQIFDRQFQRSSSVASQPSLRSSVVVVLHTKLRFLANINAVSFSSFGLGHLTSHSE